MKNVISILFALAVSSAAFATTIQPATNPIPGQFIVVLEEEQFAPVGLATVAERYRDVRDAADLIASDYNGKRQYVFSESLTGFSVRMDRRQASMLAADPRVAYVAQDEWVYSTAVRDEQSNPPSWGLDRLDQRESALDETYAWFTADSAAQVHVYVLDTGIRSTHHDFGGRVDIVNSFNAYGDGNDVNDCNGHGTHVAGIAGGDQHGVAKNVVLHPVRVLTCSGAGALSGVIAGIDWITAQVSTNPHLAVANLSLANGPSVVLDNAVRASIAAGVVYVVAAGNNGASACNYSPARVDEVITVGSTTINDTRAGDSNHGECVDIFAPGVGIVSTFNDSDTATLTMSGTSMAAPHVAGVVALLRAQAPDATPAEIADELISQANSFFDEFGQDNTSKLVYSLIDLESGGGVGAGNLDFAYKCKQQGRRCAFHASITNNTSPVIRYFWDFGDGTFEEHSDPIIVHEYKRFKGPVVTVILAVELADGSSLMTSQEVELPY